MRARLAFGLVVILAVGALAGWRLAAPAATQTTAPKPHVKVTHAAPATHIAAVNPLPVGGEGLASISESPKPKPKPAPTHSTVAPASDLPPELTGSGWQLAFDGEFGGSSLNTSQWDTCYPSDDQSGCTNSGNNNEFEWYQPSQISVSGGTLNLTAASESTQGSDGNTYPCRSGMVTTGGSFNFQYGYVQVEAKLPMSSGLWPALWLNPSNGDWPPEIDIMEHWSTYDYYGAYLHSSAGPIVENDHVDLADSTGWHTFSVLWQPNEIIWYLDGQQVLTSTQYVPQQAMYFIANVANSTNGPGCNGTMQISSVKVWQQHS
ncbi:MAG TPA: glycoside hydrolase family 16 protein [Streptosporangiaceae bacterium]|jgi:beta-glucanase (GH16 family)|nr:glycoside hydrolase family 16 protein [Streptosporangiaceae bacterium]